MVSTPLDDVRIKDRLLRMRAKSILYALYAVADQSKRLSNSGIEVSSQ